MLILLNLTAILFQNSNGRKALLPAVLTYADYFFYFIKTIFFVSVKLPDFIV